MNRPLGSGFGSTAWVGGRRGRVAFLVLVALSVCLLIFDRINHPAVERVRTVATDVAGPALDFLSRPVEAAQELGDWFSDLAHLYEENRTLREENDRLRKWQAVALKLERENGRLRTLVNAPAAAARPVATPRVVGIAGGPFVRSVLVNAGTGEGVEAGMAVIDEHGVIGRVIAVGGLTSRVLLASDLNSRIPARLERSDQNAIAVGRNQDLLSLTFLPIDADVVVGDRVVTSGHGGVFPPDLPLGRVVEVGAGRILVKPEAFLDRLDFVQILAYDLGTAPAAGEQLSSAEEPRP